MDPSSELAARSEASHVEHPAAFEGLSAPLAAELGLVKALETIAEKADVPVPMISRIRLSSSSTDEFRGNPVTLRGYPALSVAVWNANAFTVYLGAGTGSGIAGASLLTIPASKLVVFPIIDEVFSIGTDAGNIAAAEATLVVVRFAEVKAPAVYALA